MARIPRVLLIGRMNVGKSTLFNRLAPNVKSLIMDYEGVTRDYITDRVTWHDHIFEIVDTGGLGLSKNVDVITQQVMDRVRDLAQQADLIVLVGDGTVGVLPVERELARFLHKIGTPVLVAVNKADVHKTHEVGHEFGRLGFPDVHFLSAQHGTGVTELLDAIIARIPGVTAQDVSTERQCRVVLLGKPNVGKSSLMNRMLGHERSIVTEIAGTTREPVRETIRFYQEDIQLVDTAGVRRKRSVDEGLETLMVKSTLQALREADIVLLLVDGSAGQLADQELKLAFYAFEEGKALVVLFNKQDLVTDENKADMGRDLDKYGYFIKNLETLNISCKTEKNLGRILPLVATVWQRYTQQFTDEWLTELFQHALLKKPLHHKTMPLMLFRARQIDKGPITILLTVNEPKWFGESQCKFFENVLRKTVDLRGVPVIFKTAKRKK